jgi:hypothetical protein
MLAGGLSENKEKPPVPLKGRLRFDHFNNILKSMIIEKENIQCSMLNFQG